MKRQPTPARTRARLHTPKARISTAQAAAAETSTSASLLSIRRDDKRRIWSHIRQKCFVGTTEEGVRQSYVPTLRNEYGFNLDQMDEEVRVTGRGSAKAKADILIWRTAQNKRDGKTPLIVVGASPTSNAHDSLL